MFTDIEQETLDIDWFFTNSENVAFVASGGGKLPLSVAKSKENLELLFLYFGNLPERCDVIINPDLKKIINSSVDEMYLSSFVEMATKGLFSFDRTVFKFSDPNYHLVASPVDPLKFNQLPLDIQELLIKTKYTGKMEGLLNISLIE